MRIGRSIFTTFAATVAVAGLLAGCTSGDSSDADAETRTVETVYGSIEVPASPDRVVAASYDTPWQLMSLGVKPVATQDYSSWIEEFTPAQQEFVDGLPTIGPFGEYNFEAIASADPDVIVGDADEIDQATYDQLATIAPTVVVKGDSRGDWQKITTDLASALGRDDELNDSKAAYEATLDRVKSEYADVIGGNEWAHISLGDEEGQFSIQQPTGAIGNLVVNELGLKYGPGIPTDYTDRGYESYSFEQIPDILAGVTVILFPLNADGSTSETVQAVLDNTLFGRIPAAQAGHVYGLVSSVTDYDTADNWLGEVESTVLQPLSAA
ncbi:ABC transporter substrate-binding protein [Rhodococcoides yunnanense]|uniref:ABC transporter substrate-binding protein n=1 Tax=Rhodococcoides yunnanense TaxID=278209 RepID=UPI000A7377C2|nr:ABC transporter substrate-binding protein [Rhodococcus yunnanensis]